MFWGVGLRCLTKTDVCVRASQVGNTYVNCSLVFTVAKAVGLNIEGPAELVLNLLVTNSNQQGVGTG